MILVQGCSFSYGESLINPHRYRYSRYLELMMGEKVLNLAENSKDNYTMYFELHTYLLHCLHKPKEVEKPRVVIWQTTDTFRKGIVDWHYSGSWKPNNLNTLVGNYSKRHIKTIMWSKFNEINDQYKSLLDQGKHSEADAYKKQNGMGSKILSERFGHLIGDETFKHNEILFGLHINSIQDLCKQMDIQLVVVNYYGTPKDVLTDPIYKNINRDNYLLENSEEWGLYNHLCWRGFDRSVDDFHFNVDGHYYQADVLYNYLQHGRRLRVEEEVHDDMGHMPVFDYTNEKDINAAGKRYLLKLATK